MSAEGESPENRIILFSFCYLLFSRGEKKERKEIRLKVCTGNIYFYSCYSYTVLSVSSPELNFRDPRRGESKDKDETMCMGVQFCNLEQFNLFFVRSVRKKPLLKSISLPSGCRISPPDRVGWAVLLCRENWDTRAFVAASTGGGGAPNSSMIGSFPLVFLGSSWLGEEGRGKGRRRRELNTKIDSFPFRPWRPKEESGCFSLATSLPIPFTRFVFECGENFYILNIFSQKKHSVYIGGYTLFPSFSPS